MNVLSSKLFAFVHHIGSHGILGARYEGGTLMENIVLENENPSSSRYNWHLEENLGNPSFKKSSSRKSCLIIWNLFESIFGFQNAINGQLGVQKKFATHVKGQRWFGESFVKIWRLKVSKTKLPFLTLTSLMNSQVIVSVFMLHIWWFWYLLLSLSLSYVFARVPEM